MSHSYACTTLTYHGGGVTMLYLAEIIVTKPTLLPIQGGSYNTKMYSISSYNKDTIVSP